MNGAQFVAIWTIEISENCVDFGVVERVNGFSEEVRDQDYRWKACWLLFFYGDNKFSVC